MRRIFMTTATAVALAFPGMALAQTAPASNMAAGPSSDKAEPQDGVQVIIVTADRREADLQNVPATVAAIPAAELATLGVGTVAEITRLVPGLSLSRNGAGTNLYLRGVGTNSSGFNTEAPIAAYIDGFYLPNPGSTLFSFNNIERIEVLKGPQGTLYGRNATGGLVHVITRTPTQQPRIDASVGYGNYNTLSANFYGSAPLSDTVAASVAVTETNQKDGWGRNVFTGNDNMRRKETGVQGKVVWEPSARTAVTLQGMFVDVNSDQGINTAIYPGAVGTDGTPYLGRFRNSDRRDGTVDSQFYLAGLKVEQDLGFANLLSLTGYIHSEANFTPNLTGMPGSPVAGRSATNAVLFGESKTFSQELQLSSKTSSESPFSWIGGLYYYHDDTVAGSGVFGTCVGTVCAPTPVPTQTTGRPTTRSYAAYAESTYEFAARTRATLGLRYTRDEKALTGSTEPFPGLPNTPAVLPATVVLRPGDPYPGNPNGIDTAATFPKLTHKAVLAHDVTDRVHAYVSYNRGFKSGTFNPTNYSNQVSRPETLDAYEGGIKSELFDRMLRVNLAAFRYGYKDIQLRTSAAPAPPGTTITYNAATARVNGVDAEINFVPTRALSVTASATYLDAIYTSFPNATCTIPRVITATVLGGNSTVPCDNSGHRMINSSRWSYNLRGVYTLKTDVGSFALAASDSFKSRSYWDASNRLSQDPYHLVSTSLTWTSPKKVFDVQLYARNLTNSYYFVMATETSNDVYAAGAPRTFGVTIGTHF